MKLKNFTKGWLVGDFEPSLFKTNEIEVGIKTYNSGAKEAKHVHKVSTEYTIILKGQVKMLDNIYKVGDIVVIPPGIANEFECLKNAMLLVIKTPSIIGDKYEV
jgi:quercetin dioxygenase-like cupin family protein